VRALVLWSGSQGNASIIESEGTRVLVDAGIGLRALAAGIEQAGMDGPPHAIVITHAHGDHVGHCLRLSRKLKIPVYASEVSARSPALRDKVDLVRFSAREPFAIGALTIAPTPLPHDAAQVGLRISDGTQSAAIVTDLGEVPPDLSAHLAGCELVLLESNHDTELLQKGPYPAHLKRRISSAKGHLSNEQTHALLSRLSPETHTVVLMHLSATNNRADLALASAEDALAGKHVRIFVAEQDGCLVVDADAGAPREPVGARQKMGEQLALFNER